MTQNQDWYVDERCESGRCGRGDCGWCDDRPPVEAKVEPSYDVEDAARRVLPMCDTETPELGAARDDER